MNEPESERGNDRRHVSATVFITYLAGRIVAHLSALLSFFSPRKTQPVQVAIIAPADLIAPLALAHSNRVSSR
jgi:hypothetical protein